MVSKRFINFVSALTLTVVSVSNCYSIGTFSPMVSYAEGSTSSGGGTSAPSGDNVTGYTLDYNGQSNCVGVRIYLAKSTIYRDGLSRNKMHYLDTYKQYALYEFTGEYANKVYNQGFSINYYAKDDNGCHFQNLDRNQLMPFGDEGSGNLNDTGWNFKELFGDNSVGVTNPPFKYTGGDIGMETLVEWSNAQLGDLTEEQLEYFLSKYNEKLGNPEELPKNLYDFVSGEWSIIVEPLLLLGLDSNYCAVSLNDFFRPQDLDEATVVNHLGYDCSYNSIWGSKKENGGNLYNLAVQTMSGIPRMVIDTLSKYYADFTTWQGVVVNGNTDGVYLSGFGVYATNDRFSLNALSQHKINKNIAIYSDKLSPNGDIKSSVNSLDMSTDVSGRGYNGGYGQTVFAKKKNSDETLTAYSSDDATVEAFNSDVAENEYYSSDWYYNPDNPISKIKTTTKASDKADAMQKLTGTDSNAMSDNYILMHYYASTCDYFAQGEDVSGLYAGVDSDNLNFYTSEVSLDSNNIDTYTFGSNYAVKMGYGDSDNVSLANIAGDIASNIASSASTKGVRSIANSPVPYGVSDADSISNITMNMATAGLDKSQIRVSKNDKYGASQTAKNNSNNATRVGISMELMIPDEKVSSTLQTIHRDNDGNITRGTSQTEEYSVYTGSGEYTIDTSGVNTKYAVVFPNTDANSGYNSSTEEGINNFISGVFSDNMINTTYNTVDSINLIRSNLHLNTDIEGYEVCPIYDTGSGIKVGSTADGDKYTGYSIYIIDDSLEVKPQEVEMSLYAHEINYVYPTLLGDTEGHLVKTAYTRDGSYLADYNIIKNSNYGGNVIGSTAIASRFNILYNTMTGVFQPEAVDPKYFNEPSVLNHALNLNRSVYDNSIVASSFAPDNELFTRDYIENTLGLRVGNSSVPTGASNTIIKVGSGRDQFRWGCDKSFVYTDATGTRSYSVSPYLDGSRREDTGYNITESVYKYNAMSDIPSGRNESGVIAVESAIPDRLGYTVIARESYNDKELKFTPEYPMTAYYYDSTQDTIDINIADILNGSADAKIKKGSIYVIGDYERTVVPSGMYGMQVRAGSGNLNGRVQSDTMATGSGAKDLSSRLGNLPVVYSGGNISLSSSCDFDIDVSGFVLDMLDKNIDDTDFYNSLIADGSNLKVDWGNTGYDAMNEFNDWVSEVKSSIAVDISLKTYNNTSLVNTYSGYRVSSGSITGGDIEMAESKAFAIKFANGGVVRDSAFNALITAIADQYYGSHDSVAFDKAVDLFNSSDIAKTMIDSVESIDTPNNNSGDTPWYDEQVRTFVIRYFKCTPLRISNILLSDKLDIKSGPSQTVGTNGVELFTNGYTAKWYANVYLNKTNSAMPNIALYNPSNPLSLGDAINSGSVLVAEQHIDGADFIISDATTSDARR